VRKQSKRVEQVWENFADTEGLSVQQLQAFKQYSSCLLEANDRVNLTAITDTLGIVRHHFQDSLQLHRFVNIHSISTIADVGTGAGFPSLVLKIVFPHLNVLLIEMNKKKQRFLADVCAELKLTGVEQCQYDWRTFLRLTEGDIPLFVSRAALSTRELARMFRPMCSYNDATLVYWASAQWEAESEVQKFVVDEKEYKLGQRERKLIQLRRNGRVR